MDILWIRTAAFRLAILVIFALFQGCAATSVTQVNESSKAESLSVKKNENKHISIKKTADNNSLNYAPRISHQNDKLNRSDLHKNQVIKKTVTRFDVSAVNADARSFFMGLVRNSDVNIVVHPDVKGDVSIRLKQVSLEETLNAVCDVYDFDYVKEIYGYKILPRMIQTQLFKVDYLNVSREGTSNTRVSNGQVSNNNETSNSSSSTTSPSSNQTGQTSTPNSNSAIETKSETNFWETISISVSSIVGDAPGKRVVVSPQVGLVLVAAYSSELQAVERFLKRAEDALLRQVTIEAKILEVVLNDKFQAGIQWDTFEQGFGGQLALNDGRVGAGFQSGDVSKLVDISLGGIFSVGLNFTDFSSIIEDLQSQGDV